MPSKRISTGYAGSVSLSGSRRTAMSMPLSATLSTPRNPKARTAAEPANRAHSKASTRAVTTSNTQGGPNTPPHFRHRIATLAAGPVPHRGQAVRSGSPLGTDSRNTGPRSTAPASAPSRAPATAQVKFIIRNVCGRLYKPMAAGAVPLWVLLDICGSETNMPYSTAAISACARLVAPSFWYSLAT